MLFFVTASYAQLFTINSCSNLGSNTYGPMYSGTTANSNNRTAVIYPSSQLSSLAGQTLNAMYFQRSSATGTMAGTPNFKIYLKEVSAIDWGSSAIDWATEITGATLVYDSDPAAIVGSDAGWKSFPLSTNFLYSGTQNLAVFYEYINTTASSSISWNYEYTSPCVDTSNSNTTKYSNNTTGTLATSLATSNYRRPLIGFDFVVSCNAPNTVASSNLTTTTVDIDWIENAIQPQDGYEYYNSTSSTSPLPTETPTGTTANGVANVSLSLLTPATTYYFWVRGNCGTNDKSIWVGPLVYTTLCEEVTDFVENFDSYSTGSGNLPICWSKDGTSANVYITTGGAAPMSPANRLYMNISATTTAYAILPPVSNLQADTHRLRFKAYATAANKIMSVGYFTVPGDVTSYVEIEPLQMPSTNLASTQEFTVIPTGIPAGVSQLVLNVFAGTATTIYIDDVKWEVNSSCVEPNTLSASAITNSGADLGWVVGGVETEWEVQYGLNNFALGTGTFLSNLTVNSTPVSGLMANTLYQFYVRSVCSGSVYSSWSGPFTFKTLCDDVTEYFENFDSYATGSANPLPDCWSKGGTASVYLTTGANAPMSPSNRLYMYSSGTTPTEGYAILPAVSNLQANTHRLKFKAYATLADRFLEIGYLTDASNVSTFVQLEEVTLPGTNLASTQEITIIPTGIPAGVKHLVIKNPGYPSSTTTAYIDDVKWEAIPACPEPDLLTTGAITSSSAVLSWLEMGSATLWNIEYGPVGFTQGSGTVVSGVTTNPYTLTSLSPSTTYDYYVQADCGSTDGTSFWIGPFTFTTECTTFIAPYTEGFENAGAIPNCWSMSGGEDWLFSNTPGVNHIGNNGTIIGNTVTDGYFAWVDDSSTPSNDVTLLSPLVDVSTLTTPRLTFYELSNNEGNTNATLVVEVWDGAAWNSMAQYNTNTINGWEKKTISLSSLTITGDIQVKFVILGSADFYDDIAIDDVTIEDSPTTPPTCATNFVATPNASCGNEATVITWDATPLADGYYLTMGTTTGGNDVLDNVDLGAASTYSYVGLINTTYYYTVTPYNASGSATGCGEQSFTTVATGCYCTSVPTSNDGSGITNVQLGTTDFPTGDVTYFDHSATTIDFAQGITANTQITYATSIYDYNAVIWIDLNDDYIFDASEIVYTGVSGTTSPNTLNASFIMPASAALGVHKMRIVSTDIAQNPANPCYSGSYGVTLDFSVNIIVSTCTPASATATVSADCANNQYFVAVDVTALGSGTPSISDGTNTWPVTATGVVQAGPFANGSSVTLTILHGSDSTCDLPLGTFNYACPPANDECVNAIVLTVDDSFCDGVNNNGTNIASTNSGVTNASCFNYGQNDVWFSFVALVGVATVDVSTDFTGGTLVDTEIALYSGACGTLTEVACDQDGGTTILSNGFSYNSLITNAAVTAGDTYYVRVSGYSSTAVGTFCLKVSTNTLSAESFDNVSFEAYPNPVKDVLNLSHSSEITSVKVINLLGQEVISRNVGSTSTQIDMSNLSAGAYIVNVTVDNIIKSIKVIKQ